MAGDELQTIRLRNDFYRDGFNKVLLALLMILAAIILLGFISVYLFIQKPEPVTFVTDNEWRVVPPVPVDQPYLINADLLQWVSNTVPKLFIFDFISYTNQLKALRQYFTANGWKKYLALVDTYANVNTVQGTKLFINASPAAGPVIFNQGILPEGEFGWWIQMPLNINYSSNTRKDETDITLKALVIRVPTLNNLSGVAIDNIIVSKGEGGLVSNNG
jgi:intracellular multiplication protein IcmL